MKTILDHKLAPNPLELLRHKVPLGEPLDQNSRLFLKFLLPPSQHTES